MMKFKNRVMLTALLFALTISGGSSAECATVELMGYGWSKPAVTVAIKTAGAVTEEAVEDVLTAINEWKTILDDVVGPLLVFVSDIRDADIVIQLKVGGGPVLGYTLVKATKVYSCILEKASIHISGKAFGSRLSDAGIRNVARHEIGHALGIGHSDNGDDTMFFALQTSQAWGNADKPITDNDVAALDAIYPLPGFCELPESVTTGQSTLYVAETAPGSHSAGAESPGR
jgi:predicted Zn-dependent protease